METIETSEWKECERLHSKLDKLVYELFTSENKVYELEMNINNINSLFEALYRKSITANYNWQYCPSKVYIFYFEQRYEKLLADGIDISLKDYFINQLNDLFGNTGRKNRIMDLSFFGSLKINGDYGLLFLLDERDKYIYTIDKTEGKQEMAYRADFLNKDIYVIIKGSQNNKITYLINKYNKIINPTKVTSKQAPKATVDNSVNSNIADTNETSFVNPIISKNGFDTNSAPIENLNSQDKNNDLEEKMGPNEDTPQLLNGLEINTQEENILESNTKKLTQDQIALILIYEENKNINWQDIATKNGFTAKGTAVKLSQHYTKYLKITDRQGEPADPTKTKINHKIAKFKGILPYLTSDNARKRAIEDINALDKLYTEFLDK